MLIWLFAVQQVFGQLTNIFTYIGYVAGFSAGTFIGIILEEKLSVGKVLIRVITKKDAKNLLVILTKNGSVYI